uniref:Uncharacterized protein n=1 Tax=Globisporangium ultimum (strain ATCC 200006 / CBS 805.95 / DAOM BR144) TaxID=431595 RepID=K3WBQ9_GLOUD
MAKRLSIVGAADASSSGSRYVDPLYEFEGAPRAFFDLSLPPKYDTEDEIDPWFTIVHPDHSRPSAELAQEEAELQRQLQLKQQQQQQQHVDHNSSSTIHAPNASVAASTSNGSTSNRLGAGFRPKANVLNPTAALEKENRSVERPRRSNVATGLGGSARGDLHSSENGSSAKSANRLQPARGAGSTPTAATTTTTAGTAHVSGPPARLRRRSGLGAASEETPHAGGGEASNSVVRVKAQIKTTIYSAANTDAAARKREIAREPSVPQKRAAAPNHGARARFMASTASSRMAMQHTPSGVSNDEAKQSSVSQRGAATSSVKAKSTAALNKKAGASRQGSDLQELQELLARHNKKFKATHTYQPPQHSVRDVRMWEKQNSLSYYSLTSEDRVRANSEIAELVQARENARRQSSG